MDIHIIMAREAAKGTGCTMDAVVMPDWNRAQAANAGRSITVQERRIRRPCRIRGVLAGGIIMSARGVTRNADCDIRDENILVQGVSSGCRCRHRKPSLKHSRRSGSRQNHRP